MQAEPARGGDGYGISQMAAEFMPCRNQLAGPHFGTFPLCEKCLERFNRRAGVPHEALPVLNS